jgi:hypothetical protein
MAKGLFDDVEIQISCAECGQEHPKTVGWIRHNREIACGCGVTIHIDADKALAAFDETDKTIDDALGKFGKIKF